MKEVLNYSKSESGRDIINPKHEMISNWVFGSRTEDEAALAHYVAEVGSNNGMTINELSFIFPAILRMLKSNSVWAR